MMRALTRQYVAAELSALAALLETLPEADLLGRMSLESRRADLLREIQLLEGVVENRARIALYFGGEPVVGSTGLDAGFGAESLGAFQDLISKTWAAAAGNLPAMGPVPDKHASHLHITSLVHGSFGFLLEELDEDGEPMFETTLHIAVDRAAKYLAAVADENEARFLETLEQLDKRVFKSIRDLFRTVHRAKATFRLVEDEIDESFDRLSVERAWLRIESSDVEEERVTLEGELFGMIPVARRFEFQPDGAATIVEGKVGERFSQTYLDRMHEEQFAGRRWKAVLDHRIVERMGRNPVESWTLVELEEIETRPGEA